MKHIIIELRFFEHVIFKANNLFLYSEVKKKNCKKYHYVKKGAQKFYSAAVKAYTYMIVEEKYFISNGVNSLLLTNHNKKIIIFFSYKLSKNKKRTLENY